MTHKQMLFLGTGAADVLPNPFCDCPVCQEARQNPGHRRLRSAFLLDDETLIDCGPDLAAACMAQGISLGKLKRIFVTHTHEDHFCPSNAGLVAMSRTRGQEPVDVYLSEAGCQAMLDGAYRLGEEFRDADALQGLSRGLIRLHPLKTFEAVEIDGYQVLPVRTTHRVSDRETAVNYRICCPDGTRLLYACDTGIYPPDTLEALSGSAVDVLILEATFGSRTDTDTASHLNAGAFLQMLDLLRQHGVIRQNTRIYATHINHKHELTHDRYQAWFDGHTSLPVTVARDGLRAE